MPCGRRAFEIWAHVTHPVLVYAYMCPLYQYAMSCTTTTRVTRHYYLSAMSSMSSTSASAWVSTRPKSVVPANAALSSRRLGRRLRLRGRDPEAGAGAQQQQQQQQPKQLRSKASHPPPPPVPTAWPRPSLSSAPSLAPSVSVSVPASASVPMSVSVSVPQPGLEGSSSAEPALDARALARLLRSLFGRHPRPSMQSGGVCSAMRRCAVRADGMLTGRGAREMAQTGSSLLTSLSVSDDDDCDEGGILIKPPAHLRCEGLQAIGRHG